MGSDLPTWALRSRGSEPSAKLSNPMPAARRGRAALHHLGSRARESISTQPNKQAKEQAAMLVMGHRVDAIGCRNTCCSI